MLNRVERANVSTEGLRMPDQDFRTIFRDNLAPDLDGRIVPGVARWVLFGLPLGFSTVVAVILVTAFRSDGQLKLTEIILLVLMALLSGWEAIPSANAIIGFIAAQKPQIGRPEKNLTIAILVTIRGENANKVIVGKLKLLQALRGNSHHRFAMHILSDSTSFAHVADERNLVASAFPLAVFHHHRPVNVDYKSGNIRSWIERHGADYDAFIILDADSQLDCSTVFTLADALAGDPACGLIQTIPIVLPGSTRWQEMQSVASRTYGGLQGKGLAAWMGDEANYFGHNAIIRTEAFARCAGLPHLEGRGLWNGTILSHDFVEAALLRRAGWAVRLLPIETGSFEQAPTDMIAYLKRDARWCLGNFQHSRMLRTAGLHSVSRLHLISGILNYVASAVWLATLVLWAMLEVTQTGVGGHFAALALVLIAANLLLPRFLGVLHATWHNQYPAWPVVKSAMTETMCSSIFAPALMIQRVKIIGGVLANRKLNWVPFEKSNRNLLDYCAFHVAEVLSSLGLLACVERGILTPWFLPLAVCLLCTPAGSWIAGQSTKAESHEELNGPTPL